MKLKNIKNKITYMSIQRILNNNKTFKKDYVNNIN